MKLVLLTVALCICSTLNVEANKGCQAGNFVLHPGQLEFIKSHSDFDPDKTKYSPNENCQWDIEVSENKVPEIKFTTFILGEKRGGCDGDVVKVWSGNSPVNTNTDPDFEFCGAPKGLAAVTGRGKHMTVIFKTDASNQNVGFSAVVTERDNGCSQRNNYINEYNAVNFYPRFGITCQWSFNDSIDLTFDKFYLKDDDSVIVYNLKDLKVIEQMSGAQLNQEGIHVIHGKSSMLVEFTSSTDLLMPTPSTHEFAFRYSYNCHNFEIIHHQNGYLVNVTWARPYCHRMKGEWDLAVTDKQCKHDMMIKKFKDVNVWFPQWFGLYRRNSDFYWVNGNKLQTTEAHWKSGEPNNRSVNCVTFQNKQWKETSCSAEYPGVFCSRVKI